MAIRVSLLSLLVISSANLTFALYEDQVDLMDWYQQHISKVLQAVFQTQKAVWKRVVVAAEENAIASLDLRINFESWEFSRGAVSVGIFPSDLSAVKVTAIHSAKSGS
uniref:EMC1 first beta-propeller domain-containing protein n=1 Tax=Kalanchoe fedtschenkoi TaxID=63787 RepID=A0A7N0TU00_KALFE